MKEYGQIKYKGLSFCTNGNIDPSGKANVYTHFEGGFFEKYLAFSATNSSSSVFAVIDTVAKEQTGGFDSTGYFGVNVDETLRCTLSGFRHKREESLHRRIIFQRP